MAETSTFQVASILNILDDELVENVGNYIQRLVPRIHYLAHICTFVDHLSLILGGQWSSF